MVENYSEEDAWNIAETIKSELVSNNINVEIALYYFEGDSAVFIYIETSENSIYDGLQNAISTIASNHGGIAQAVASQEYTDYDTSMYFIMISEEDTCSGVGAARQYEISGTGVHWLNSTYFFPGFISFASPAESMICAQLPENSTILSWIPTVNSTVSYTYYNVTWTAENGTALAKYSVQYAFDHPLEAEIKKEVIFTSYDKPIKIRISIKNLDSSLKMENLSIDDSLTTAYYPYNTSPAQAFYDELGPGEEVVFEYELGFKYEGYYYLAKTNVSYIYNNSGNVSYFSLLIGAMGFEIPLYHLIDIINRYVPGGILTIIAIAALFVVLELKFRLKLFSKPKEIEVATISK